MEQYKIIDGVVYKVIDTTEIKSKMVTLSEKIKPYRDGISESEKCIKAYQDQIESYKKQINLLVQTSAIDPEIMKLVDPSQAHALGFQ